MGQSVSPAVGGESVRRPEAGCGEGCEPFWRLGINEPHAHSGFGPILFLMGTEIPISLLAASLGQSVPLEAARVLPVLSTWLPSSSECSELEGNAGSRVAARPHFSGSRTGLRGDEVTGPG